MTAAKKTVPPPSSAPESARLILDKEEVALPLVRGTEGEVAIDISRLRASTGLVTLDPGFVNTASCTSAITFLDGEKGILHYRGHAIEDLAAGPSFTDVGWLLIRGQLPDKEQSRQFAAEIEREQALAHKVKDLIPRFPREAHPMAMLSGLLTTLSTFDPEGNEELPGTEVRQRLICRLLGAAPVLAAWIYQHGLGQAPGAPAGGDYAASLLEMMFGRSPEADVATAMNQLLILHADHEQNCSTSTVRLAGSSRTSVYAAVASGVAALWGPLHGGANQAVIAMLEAIRDDGGDTQKYLAKARDKDDPFRLMGFGHRVYKNFDPRARIIKGACDAVLARFGGDDELLGIARGLEAAALNDEYFVAVDPCCGAANVCNGAR